MRRDILKKYGLASIWSVVELNESLVDDASKE